MTKRRFSALFLTLTLALLFCSLPAAAAEGDGWLVYQYVSGTADVSSCDVRDLRRREEQ